MRNAFIETLFELASKDSRIILMVGDLGFGVVTKFMERLPNQFLNVGIAEQNMLGLATGMALSGKIVFTYSIANFAVLRPLEQIRNDVCYHNANVRIVPVGCGMAYGSLGTSHHATEDIAIMRALPNILVVAPGDPFETKLAVRALIGHDGPAYLRLGRAGEPRVHEFEPEFVFGKGIIMKQGTDVTLISTGGMLYNTVEAAKKLDKKGISARVISMHTLKPIDKEALQAAATETSAIFTIEEHSVVGGLGGAVAEILMESDLKPKIFKRIGLNGNFSSVVGSQEYLKRTYELDPSGILATVCKSLGV